MVYCFFDIVCITLNTNDFFYHLFKNQYSTLLAILPVLFAYIISINMNFHNVKFLTQKYMIKYIVTNIILDIFIYIILILIWIYFIVSDTILIQMIIFLVLKLLYTIIYFKIKSKKFISEEEYIKEQQQIILIKKESIVEEENKQKNVEKYTKKSFLESFCSIIASISSLIYIISLILMLLSDPFDIDNDFGVLLIVNLLAFINFAIGYIILLALSMKK